MNVPLSIDPAVRDLAVGLVEAQGVTIESPGEALVEQCQAAVAAVMQSGLEGGDERRQAVRRLLRHGGFKPSGRNKPAQEYLVRTAGSGQWPTILNAVDVLNVVSLRSGLPISLLALNRLQTPLLIRYGHAEESLVFNQSGQTLNVEGLVSVCHTVGDQSQPVGTPVKDSQFGKVTGSDTHLLACIFAPQSSVDTNTLQFWADELAAGFGQWCAPSRVESQLCQSES